MRRHGMPTVRETGVNVTPLIDIVMVMIVFFMLVARIGISTGAEPMSLPETILGTRIEDLGNTLTLNVWPPSDPADAGPRVTTLVNGQKRQLRLAQATTDGASVNPLLLVLEELRRHNPDLKVIIRAEKSLNYRYLEPVLMACAQADVRNVNFTTAVVTEQRAP